MSRSEEVPRLPDVCSSPLGAPPLLTHPTPTGTPPSPQFDSGATFLPSESVQYTGTLSPKVGPNLREHGGETAHRLDGVERVEVTVS